MIVSKQHGNRMPIMAAVLRWRAARHHLLPSERSRANRDPEDAGRPSG